MRLMSNLKHMNVMKINEAYVLNTYSFFNHKSLRIGIQCVLENFPKFWDDFFDQLLLYLSLEKDTYMYISNSVLYIIIY